MHILATTSASLDDGPQPVDLGQAPADMVALSFSPSDLAGLSAAWRTEGHDLPSLRLASLAALRHPMSVDLWMDAVAAHARVILVRILGGYDWWRYGCDRLGAIAREKGIALALLPGECRDEDASLDRLSTLPKAELTALLACFREGGPANMAALLRRLAHHAGAPAGALTDAEPLPRFGCLDPQGGVAALETIAPDERPLVPILFYRSVLLANDHAPVTALAEALERRGLRALPVFVPSLKDAAARAFLADLSARLSPALIVSTTAFASGGEAEAGANLFDALGVPVLQAVVASTSREAWSANARGLGPSDLAMHVILPELDGRVLAGALSFKQATAADEALGFAETRNAPELDRVEMVAERTARLLRLRTLPPGERRVALLLPDYPGSAGREGYAVGLDVWASALAILEDLRAGGYDVGSLPPTSRDLFQALEASRQGFDASAYAGWFGALAPEPRAAVLGAWGPPPADPATFRALRFGKVTVALAPDRGRSADRRADYHDPALPPAHALLAFGAWLQDGFDAIVHLGAHGTLEWLPGKTVALTAGCFPEIVAGPLPVVYPFIVSNPGEAAQAKRRIAAVTIGHLPPPLLAAGLDPDGEQLERLVDEYAQADGLDRRRRERLAEAIVKTAAETGLAAKAGVSDGDDPDAALLRIDAWLCDLKDMAIKDGLHVFGRAAPDETDTVRLASAGTERAALLAALGGGRVAAGPSGAPARGRTDVLPTGRNLFTFDPRHLPTPTAWELGRRAAEEVLRRHLQEEGDWPRVVVIDLWGSASLRTGGEEIAQGLALMGCRPRWDPATGRAEALEVLAPAELGRPRVDVSFRISGLFRDMFPVQIALLDAAAQAVAARDDAPGDNPLAETARESGRVPPRIFGSAPGTFGAGVEDALASGDWEERGEIGRAYLDGASHAFGGPEGAGAHAPDAFGAVLGEADLLIHTSDDPGRDLLEGSADVAFVGGFAAAVELVGGHAEIVTLDTTDPKRPRPRSLKAAMERTVRARALNERFIAGQMRHGPRGASEFAETVDRLVGFAETTGAVAPALIEAVHDRYLGDPDIRAFLLRENPGAAALIARRFADARRRGLWSPLRNAVDADLAALIAEARGDRLAEAAE
ncbi:cobaltochelatase subunit CobN [Antarcticirhabdus aurantiaca]|uniref:Cobaltochelatase subunit CobN n=1 Tax=Antarcticirhabdus aurantiaca TaxID=2606717 RepID=A0ACD4NHQ5_9HYPH|nr:cobaltochelatase subunit CobN [Antarcticirhabdus aurantiaca]WAJ26331.1 cobaltochelatase subunit CobN [Jeongeuplla avenae]